jgi:Flp pilus assembly protein TadG
MRTVKPGRWNRQGFTLVVMTLMMTVFIGAAAFATDFGKMYLIRGQLQTAADAAALAGMFEVAMGNGSIGLASAQAYGAKHKVGATFYPAGSVVANPGTWNGTTFTPNGGNWTTANPTAVQVIVNYTGTYTFGRFFGFNTRTLYDTAVAIRGGVQSSTCVRPWAVPYQALLDVLDPTLTPAYNLTTADINTLRAMTTANNITLKVGTAGGYTQHGEFYAARLPPKYYADGTLGATWTGGNDYGDGIGGTCGQLSTLMTATGAVRGATVSVGDYLEPETGNKAGPTGSGINAMCGGDICNPPHKITVALWDNKVTTPCDCYRIKYLGAFAITQWRGPPDNEVLGYFTAMATNGAITGTGGPPGPSEGVGLRK